MEFLKPPEPIRFDGDISKHWQLFKQKFEFFLTASETGPKPGGSSTKTALLLSLAGDAALEVFNNFTFLEGESKEEYVTVVKKFDEYCAAQQNEVHERYLFRQRVQADGEPSEQFIRDLRKLSRYCNFGVMADSMIRDQVVYGTNSEKVREKLLRDNELTLAKAEQVCKAAELSAAQHDVWRREQRQVDRVKKTDEEQHTTFRCRRCGRQHGPQNCPAFGRTCRRCGGKNNFAARCKSAKEVAEVQSSEEDLKILDVSIDSVINQRDWIAQAQVANADLSLKIDTGAQANLLPYSTYRKLNPKAQLAPSNAMLRSYGGAAIKHLGITTLKVSLGRRTVNVPFFVVKKGRQAILGLRPSELLGLFTRCISEITTNTSEQVAQEYQDVFTGIGCIQRRYKMVLQPNSVPTVQVARRVPLALQGPLRAELDRM
ncbi:uncharacterized protein LOC144165064 [Haemaphysalis longicornis]